MNTCKTCIFYDPIDELTFWCDIHGVCSADDLATCRGYIPMDVSKPNESEDSNEN